MKKVICFSLWGNEYRYLGGALQNVELAKYFYPDWVCRFYIGKSTNEKFKNTLKSFDNVEIVEMEENGDWRGMFWRFFGASDETVDIMISRDADSRIHRREVEAVNEWVNSDKKFHIMRDHQYHSVPLLGGMWGVKKGFINDIVSEIKEYNGGDFWQVDQNFLKEKIFDRVIHDSMVHDEMHRYVVDSNRYPNTSRNESHFVGQAYAGSGIVLDAPPNFNDFLFETEGFRIKVYEESELV